MLSCEDWCGEWQGISFQGTQIKVAVNIFKMDEAKPLPRELHDLTPGC